MSAIESIGRAGLHALMVRPDCAQRCSAEFGGRAAVRLVLLRRVLDSNPAREALDELRAAGAAVVMYGELAELRDFDSVVSDHDAGSYLLTKWLLGQGKRRILRFWQLGADTDYAERSPEWLMNRDSGFERTMREANIEPIPAIVHQDPIAHDNTEENFKTFMHLSVGQLMPYLSQPRSVDAIMLTSDGVLASTAAACRLFGITPNREVLLVGYDNFWPDDAPRKFSRRFRRRPSISRTKSSASNSLNCSWRAGGKLGDSAEHRLVQPKLLAPDGSVE